MDSHDRHHRLLAAFVAGNLGPAGAGRWDEHMLECERCWRAVREDRSGRQAAQLLRQPTPAGLADRVALAVEMAAARPASRRPPQPRLRERWQWLAGAGTVAAALAVILTVLLLQGGSRDGSVPASVAAVARYAETLGQPAHQPEPGSSGWATPVEVGKPVTMTAGGQRIVLRIWRLGRMQAVVAGSSRPFPMPSQAQDVPSRSMAWLARIGKLSLYCLNGRTSELVAAPVPAPELARLVAHLPLG